MQYVSTLRLLLWYIHNYHEARLLILISFSGSFQKQRCAVLLINRPVLLHPHISFDSSRAPGRVAKNLDEA